MQILQKSNLHSIRAVSCSLRRTRKSHYCGNYDHGISVDSDDFTYNPQLIEPSECQRYHREKEVLVNRIGDPYWKSQRIKLKIGQQNIYNYYIIRGVKLSHIQT